MRAIDRKRGDWLLRCDQTLRLHARSWAFGNAFPIRGIGLVDALQRPFLEARPARKGARPAACNMRVDNTRSAAASKILKVKPHPQLRAPRRIGTRHLRKVRTALGVIDIRTVGVVEH